MLWYVGYRRTTLVSDTPAPAGIVYFLPKTTIVLDLTWRISRCDVVRRAGTEPSFDVIVDSSIEVAEFSAKAERDLKHGYAIKTGSLDGMFWSTDFGVGLSNGLLISVNSVSKGQALPNLEKIEKILSTAVSTATAQIAFAPEADAETKRLEICGKSLVDALDTKDTKSSSVRMIFRFDPDECPSDFVKDKEGRCLMTGGAALSQLLPKSDAVTNALNKSSIEVKATPVKLPETATSIGKGIAYQIPGAASIQVCSPKCGADGRTIVSDRFAVSQFGLIKSLPVQRRMFSDRDVTLNFGPSGDLTQARFTDAESKTAGQ